ncbi:MAG: GTP-binding protein [Verrucomicrobia bacterium]|jgi:G3E family GTPase|nr:GTP-binding protein [Verrucomicrobiota bacterium]
MNPGNATEQPPAAKHRLPVILVTGFLGSGKTTLLLRWLRESPATGLRMGVVMNEFGAESVDSQILDRPGLPVAQVSGGCVCCAPENELDRAVTQLAKSGDCDYIIVETSGLADPDNVIDVLTDTDLLEHAQLHAVVSVVDAPWYAQPEGDIGERILARKQIDFANVLCLSKCDRLDPHQLDSLETIIAEQNPRAQRIRLPFGLPDIGDLLRRPPAEVRIDAANGAVNDEEPLATPHLHTGYRSVTWRFPVPVERKAFETFLSRLNPREVVRAKGFVRFTHAPEKLFLFQQVWGHHFIEEFPALPHPAAIAVLIGPNLDPVPHQAALRSLCFGTSRPSGLSLSAE